jgi:chromosome segregation ATPase
MPDEKEMSAIDKIRYMVGVSPEGLAEELFGEEGTGSARTAIELATFAAATIAFMRYLQTQRNALYESLSEIKKAFADSKPAIDAVPNLAKQLANWIDVFEIHMASTQERFEKLEKAMVTEAHIVPFINKILQLIEIEVDQRKLVNQSLNERLQNIEALY